MNITLSRKGKVVDEVSSYFAMRKVSADIRRQVQKETHNDLYEKRHERIMETRRCIESAEPNAV